MSVTSDFSSFKKRLSNAISKHVDLVSKDIKNNLVSEIPVDRGNLKSSVHVKKIDDKTTQIGHDPNKTKISEGYGPYNYGNDLVSDYGSIVYYGHGVIKPRREGGKLSWVGKDGKRIFAKQVKAVAPNNFIGRAVKKSKGNTRKFNI